MGKSKINPDDIIPLNVFEAEYPIIIDVVYAQPDHPDNVFKNLYHPDAQIMWAHKDLAATVLLAAHICREHYGWKLKIDDCLRPVEAQEKMAEYGYDPSLVSLPGSGAHPRAMAIDVEPLDETTGAPIDMGTPFDFFVDDPAADNPAARHYMKFENFEKAKEFYSRRIQLEFAMLYAGTVLGHEIKPLPQEWWDFRFKDHVVNAYDPLTEKDLHPYQRLINPDSDAVRAILAGTYPQAVQAGVDEVRAIVSKALQNI